MFHKIKSRLYMFFIVIISALFFINGGAFGEEWPMWRFDASRTAASSLELPSQLHLQWVRELPEPTRAWPPQMDDGDKLEFDLSHPMIVHHNTVFVAQSSNHALTAFDLEDGEEKWRFYGEGPFRLAPAAHEGKVYAGCDDGYLYCLDAESGELVWKFRAVPSGNRVIGNHRFISAWPVRGAPVISEGVLYFGAGSFPFMGTFIYALDALSGEVLWINSTSGSEFMSQPHQRSGSFSGVAPQGYLALDGDFLVVAQGRARPAVFCRESGDLLSVELHGKRNAGGYDVMASGGFIYLNGEMLRTDDVVPITWEGRHAFSVLASGKVYGVNAGKILCHEALPSPVTVPDRRGEEQERFAEKLLWTAEAPEGLERLHIKSGHRLYGSGDGTVFGLDVIDDEQGLNQGHVEKIWEYNVGESVWTMAAANGRLLVMTVEGNLHVFGREELAEPGVHRFEDQEHNEKVDLWMVEVDRLLSDVGINKGYVLLAGIRDGRMAEELLRQSDMYVVMLDNDPDRLRRVRERLDGFGYYGRRASAVNAEIADAGLPDYMFDLILTERAQGAGLTDSEHAAETLFSALRPYGGLANLELDTSGQELFLSRSEIISELGGTLDTEGGRVVMRRPGSLPGSGWWTHQNADPANSGISPDRRVRAPLGLLWFGGPSNCNVLPRHGRGPVPQVVGGRLFIMGPDSIQARDVYTGRKIWIKKIPGIGEYYDTWTHQPGADQVGAPYVSLPDGVYVANKSAIIRLDPASGETLSRFLAPVDEKTGERPDWGFISVQDDLIVAGLDPLIFTDERPGGNNWNAISSRSLVVMDRISGEIKWTREARQGYRHNAIVSSENGRVFVVDRMPEEVRDKLVRRGEQEPDPILMCLDIVSGEALWETREGVFGTWLGYSEKHDLILQAGRHPVSGRQALSGEPERMAVHSGSGGSRIWERDFSYRNAPLLSGDNIIVHGRAYCLMTGKEQVRRHPLTGGEAPWSYSASANCGQIIGSANLLTYRRGTGTFFDMEYHTGTSDIGGLRSGCTPNLVPADGVLNAPDYTRECTCAYQFQTSLALVPMDSVEGWAAGSVPGVEDKVKEGGINFGAPGNRRIGSTLWLGYPGVGGANAVSINVTSRGGDAPKEFNKHPALVSDAEKPWVSASGIEGDLTVEMLLGPGESGQESTNYTLSFYFLEPENISPGERSFDVIVQNEKLLADFDIVSESGGMKREVSVEFRDVKVSDILKVELRSSEDAQYPPLLSGIRFYNDDQLSD